MICFKLKLTIFNIIKFLILLNLCRLISCWKIINGSRATINEFPEMVSIKINGRHFCGGTLINSNTVLTAAHCIWDLKHWSINLLKRNKIQVFLGEYDVEDKDENVKVFQVIKLLFRNIYANKQNYVHGNDVALVKFNGSISRNQYQHIKYAILDYFGLSVPGDRCEIVGWGSKLYSGKNISHILQKATLIILSNRECAKLYDSGIIERNKLCAGSGPLSTNSCAGDSGGPLFFKDGLNQNIQIGINSYGSRPCGLPNVPSVFTRVAHVIRWILLNK